MKILTKKIIFLIIITISNNTFASNKKEIIYTPIRFVGEEYSFGTAFPGDVLSSDNMTLKECKKFVKNKIKEVQKKYQKIYKEKKENNDKDTELYNPKIYGESRVGSIYYFCWPDSNLDDEFDERFFIREHGYISPKTKDKIFPLGERKYTNEPKVKMELAEEDKK